MSGADSLQSSDPTPPPSPASLTPLVPWREPLAVLLIVALADLTLYCGPGFAGYAAWFAGATACLCLGATLRRGGAMSGLIAAMLWVLAAKLVWSGSSLLVGAGFVLLVAFAMTLSGMRPHVLEGLVFASQTIPAGYARQVEYWRSLRRVGPLGIRLDWLSLALPAVVFGVFGFLFLLANPDLYTLFGDQMERILYHAREWIVQFIPAPGRAIFWCAVAWITLGLLRPLARTLPDGPWVEREPPEESEPAKPSRAPMYAPFRNTLTAVMVLFAVYLVFEFKTLWFRVFPPGFYYSGYAHQGAAWLTLALALATFLLSVVFRGAIRRDPRVQHLRRLAWIWSFENLLLAVAVYHRMLIYIGFNGMTRMRVVGLLGISTVVAGFALVLGMIAYHHTFTWLVRRQLWALGFAIYLFALMPVDMICVRYNVRRILAGDPAPAVQISVHPINSEGVLELLPLLDVPDAAIREGVGAMLAQRQMDAEQLAHQQRELGWTAFQLSDRRALKGLRGAAERWSGFSDRQRRAEALERFHAYAYQWY
jgi:hypothetical protein